MRSLSCCQRVGSTGTPRRRFSSREAEGLFAGVADGFCGIVGGGLAEVGEDRFGDLRELGGVGDGDGIDGEEELGEAGFFQGIGGELVGGEATGEHGGHHVEDQ